MVFGLSYKLTVQLFQQLKEQVADKAISRQKAAAKTANVYADNLVKLDGWQINLHFGKFLKWKNLSWPNTRQLHDYI